jgi:cell division transport system ATP-binding protein
VIKFTDVTKIYKDGAEPALDGVSFAIEPGEFVFLVGASGSGKSTLLSMILRAERFNSGQIHVAGRNLRTLTNWRTPEYRQKIGVVFQNFRLLNSKTVYENVAFALQVIGKSKREIRQLVPAALELVGLADKADRLPDQLSGGERQRTAIARAFVNKPLIILADEPTGNLDPRTSQEIMQVFNMINQMGTTILMATHSQEIVNTYKRRVIELVNGRIVRDEENASYAQAATDIDASQTQNSGVGLNDETDQDNQLTIAVPDLKKLRFSSDADQATSPVNSVDTNQTVRIPKMPRKSIGESLSADSEDAFDHFYEDSETDFFHSGTFDATEIRNNEASQNTDGNEVE